MLTNERRNALNFAEVVQKSISVSYSVQAHGELRHSPLIWIYSSILCHAKKESVPYLYSS